MKRKYFLIVLFLVLAIFLSGCAGGGIVTPSVDVDETKVKGIINNYWLALSNRQYGLAKSYCILNGEFYRLAEEYQSMPYIGSSTVTFTPYVNWVEITGNSAKANINLTVTVTFCFDGNCSSGSETLYNYSIYLDRVSGAWKLK